MKILFSCMRQNSMILALVFTVLMIFQHGVSQTTPYTWKSVVVGCGGYVSGIVYHPTVKGLKYARTDIWNRGCNRRWFVEVN